MLRRGPQRLTPALTPDLETSLTFEPETGKLTFKLANAGDTALSDLSLTISVPPAFEPGMLRWNCEEVAGGGEWSIAGDVSERRAGDYWRSGESDVAAQLDFLVDGLRGRLFTTCTVAERPVQDSQD